MKKSQIIPILSLLLALAVLTGCAVSAEMLSPQETVPQEPVRTIAPTDPAPAVTKLTPEEAQAIALADAGLTAETAARLRTEYEVDDGVPEYEVEFRSGNYEYDYTIHAESGAILRRSKEYDPPATQPPESVPAPTEPAKTITAPAEPAKTEQKITPERAESIALAHVGLRRSDVTGLKTEYDMDDGIPEYEVEFRAGKLEYDFEIHAETGAILDFDCDD